MKHGCMTNWLVCKECCKCKGKHLSKQIYSVSSSSCVCQSEWFCQWEKRARDSGFVCFLFRCVCLWCVSVCVCVCVCMLDGEGSTLHESDKYTFANLVCTLSWTEQCHTVCTSVWPHCHNRTDEILVLILWGPRSLLLLCWFQNHEILKSGSLWLELTWNGLNWTLAWNGFDLEWVQSLMK